MIDDIITYSTTHDIIILYYVQLQSSEICDGLTAEYPATLKQPPKIGRYGDTQSLHTYPRICVST